MASIAKTAIVIGGDASELEASVAKAGASLKSMVTGAVTLLATTMSVKWGVDLLKASQTAQFSMEAVVGSAELAKSTLKGLRNQFGDEAKNFHQGFKDLALAGVSLEDIPKILDVIGNAASALSPGDLKGGIDGLVGQLVQIKETGHITEKQLKSLGATGVNAFEILRQANGFDTVGQLRDALGKDQLDAGKAIKDLLAGMDKQFAGSFERVQGQHIGELLEDFGDRASQGMLAFMKGAVGGDFNKWLKTLSDEMAALETIGESVGKNVGNAFKIVGNVFEGVYTVAKTLAEVIGAAFSGESQESLSEFLDETAKLKLNLTAVKDGALTFAEVVSQAFAYLGDKISQYLVDPLQAFAGMFVTFVGDLIHGLKNLINLLPDMVIPDGWIENLDAAGSSLNKIGDNLVERAQKDFAAGDVMLDRTTKFFEGLRANVVKTGSINGGVASGPASGGSGGIPILSAATMNFAKSIENLTSLNTDLAAAATAELKARREKADDELKQHAKGIADAAKSPVDKFREEMDKILDAGKRGDLTRQEMGAGALNAFRGLASNLPTYSPNSAIAAGSSEAQRAIQENRFGGKRTVDDLLKQALVEAKEQRKIQEDILKQLEKSKIVPVGL